MKKSKIVAIFILFSLLTAIFFFWGCDETKENKVTVGAILPLTGNSATIGNWHKDGLDFYINTVQPDLIVSYEDSKNNAKDGINAFRKLRLSGVNYIISAMSTVSVPLKEIVKQNDIPMFVTSVSYPDYLTKSDENIFRYNLTSDSQAALILEDLIEKNKKGVNFYYIDDEYGVGALKVLKEHMDKNDDFFINEIPYSFNTTEFNNLVLKNSDIYPIYVIGYGTAYIGILRKIFEVVRPENIYSDYGMEFDAFVKPLGEADVDVIFTGPEVKQNDSYNKFVNDFYNEYNYKPNLVNIFSYDLLKYIDLVFQELPKKTIVKSVYGYEMVKDSLGNIIVPLELKQINIKEKNNLDETN